jgi:hypothetical protein
VGKDQFGDSDKSRRIPPETIEKAKKPPADQTKKPETDKK